MQALFDIEHGRRLLRSRPDLAQGSKATGRPQGGAPSSWHALDALWDSGTDGTAGGDGPL